MDDPDKTFGERVDEIRDQRRPDPVPPGGVTGLSTLENIDPQRPLGDPAGQPSFRTLDDGDDEIEQLRRDISRLEGKVDALLQALEVGDSDG